MAHTIACADCGADYETSRRNTKYCSRCALIKTLIFMGPGTRRCWLCEKEFAPLDSKDVACGDCCYEARGHGETECKFCHETAVRVRKDADLCNRCARDPKLRSRVVLALRKAQLARRQEAAV